MASGVLTTRQSRRAQRNWKTVGTFQLPRAAVELESERKARAEAYRRAVKPPPIQRPDSPERYPMTPQDNRIRLHVDQIGNDLQQVRLDGGRAAQTLQASMTRGFAGIRNDFARQHEIITSVQRDVAELQSARPPRGLVNRLTGFFNTFTAAGFAGVTGVPTNPNPSATNPSATDPNPAPPDAPDFAAIERRMMRKSAMMLRNFGAEGVKALSEAEQRVLRRTEAMQRAYNPPMPKPANYDGDTIAYVNTYTPPNIALVEARDLPMETDLTGPAEYKTDYTSLGVMLAGGYGVAAAAGLI